MVNKLLEVLGSLVSWPVAYRLVRTAVATAFVQTAVLQPDWTNPEAATKTLVVSFVAGFLVALSKGVRDAWGAKDGSKGAINRLIPV